MALNRNSADYKALVADIAAAVWAQPIDAQNINGKPVKWRAGAILVDAREFARRVMSR